MPRLHVLTHRQALDRELVADKSVVVIDVLFATTSIVTVIDAGAAAVVPATDPERARSEAPQLTDPAPLAAGELRGEIPPGFAHFAPLRLGRRIQPGRTVVYSTSNGTPAVCAATGAHRLYVGALINAPALARRVSAEAVDGRTLLLVCAGTLGTLNLEDFYCAGCLVDELLRDVAVDWQPSDAALASLGLFRSQPALAALEASRVGRLMMSVGLGDEVEFAARTGVCDAVVGWSGDRLLRLTED